MALELNKKKLVSISVGNPDVSGPPGSGSISQRYASGSKSFPFLIKVFERIEIMLAKKNFHTQF
jgi:hypothetical protein